MEQNTNIYNIIGKNIKKYRKQKGLTQRQLADANFLSDSFIAKLESVTYQTISIETLEKIAMSLDVEISKFFDSINDYMNEFEKVVVYYDNGQEALGAIIDTLLITKNNVEHRIEFDHKEKRLFQVSDMLTFVDKIVYKHNHNMSLTKAEKYFFSVKDILGIIRQLKSKRL